MTDDNFIIDLPDESYHEIINGTEVGVGLWITKVGEMVKRKDSKVRSYCIPKFIEIEVWQCEEKGITRKRKIAKKRYYIKNNRKKKESNK